MISVIFERAARCSLGQNVLHHIAKKFKFTDLMCVGRRKNYIRLSALKANNLTEANLFFNKGCYLCLLC